MIRYTQVCGHSAIELENASLRVVVLPEKGADIYSIVYKPTGVDFLYKTHSGLKPPAQEPPRSIIENYEGGWQELFPNTGAACVLDGIEHPVHGEVALLPWEASTLSSSDDDLAIRLVVNTRRIQCRLERVMRLNGQAKLMIQETITNLSPNLAQFVWGHHLVLGGNFLESGCLYQTTARTIRVPDQPNKPANARLQAGQISAWPVAIGRNPEEFINLSYIPGPEIHTHDDAFLTDLEDGQAKITNPRLGISFKLSWDAAIFGCLVMWQPYGGLEEPPWTGSYGVGMEPWTTHGNLLWAIEHGKALHLEPDKNLQTTLVVEVEEIEPATML